MVESESGVSSFFQCNLTVLIRSQRVYFQLPPEFWSYKNCRCAATYWGEPPFCQKVPLTLRICPRYVLIFIFWQCSDKVRCGGEDLYITETQYPVFGANSSLLGLLPCEHCEDGVARFGHTAHYEVGLFLSSSSPLNGLGKKKRLVMRGTKEGFAMSVFVTTWMTATSRNKVLVFSASMAKFGNLQWQLRRWVWECWRSFS